MRSDKLSSFTDCLLESKAIITNCSFTDIRDGVFSSMHVIYFF